MCDVILHLWIIKMFINVQGAAENMLRLLEKSMDQWKIELTAEEQTLSC